MADKLRFDIDVSLDNKTIERELKSLQTTVDDGIINNLEKQLSAVQSAIKKSTSLSDIKALRGEESSIQSALSGAEKGEGASSITGMLGKGLGIVAGIFAGMNIISQALKTVDGLIGGIGKMISMLLRPIADVVTMLLMPILSLLRPIVQIVNTLMLPFRQAAMTLASSAMRDIVQGFNANDATMIGKGLMKSLLSINTLFLGFENMLLKVGVKLIRIVVDGIFEMSKFITKGMFVGLGTIVGLFNKTGGQRLAAVGGSIVSAQEASMDNFWDFVDASIDYGTDFAKQGIVDSAAMLGVDISESLKRTFEEGTYGDIVGAFIERQAAIAITSLNTIGDILSGKYDKLFDGEKLSAVFDTGAQLTASEIQLELEKVPDYIDFTKFTENLSQNIGDSLPSGNLFSGGKFDGAGASGGWGDDFSQMSMTLDPSVMDATNKILEETGQITSTTAAQMQSDWEAGLLHVNDLTQEYMGNSIIPDAFGQGFMHMNKLTSDGLSKMKDSINDFVSKLKSAASAINSIKIKTNFESKISDKRGFSTR